MQNRTGAITLLLLLISWWLSGQSCPVVTNTTVQILPNGASKVCPGGKVRVSTLATNISLDHYLEIYAGTTPNFDPLANEGSLLETVRFDQGNCTTGNCPTLIGAMINGCGASEPANEYLMLSSGGGFRVDELTVDYDTNNNIVCPNDCDDIGAGCSIVAPNFSLPGCSNVHSAGPGDVIPPNAIVIVFTSADASPAVYNWGALCGVAGMFQMPIYLLKSSCTRQFGAFTDMPGADKRTYGVGFCSGCSGQIEYSGNYPQDGTFYSTQAQPLNCIAYPNVSPKTLSYDVTLDETGCGATSNLYFKLVWKDNQGCILITTPAGNPGFTLDCPPISILGDSVYCSGTNLTLTGQGTFTSWKWKSGSFQRTGKSIQLNNQQGIFTLTGTTNNQCSASTSVQIYQIASPDNHLQYFPNDTICLNEPVSIVAPSADSYLWSTGTATTNPSIDLIVTDDVDFSVTLTNAGLCSTEVQGQVFADRNVSCLTASATCPQPDFMTFNDTFCLGSVLFDTLELDLPIAAGDSVQIRWHGPGIIDSTNRFVPYVTGGGTFNVTAEITLHDSCFYTVNNTIVLLDPTVELLTDSVVCLDAYDEPRKIVFKFTGEAPYVLSYYLDDNTDVLGIFQTDSPIDSITFSATQLQSVFRVEQYSDGNLCLGRLLSFPIIQFKANIESQSVLVDCLGDTAWRATIAIAGDPRGQYGFYGTVRTMNTGTSLITDPIPSDQDLDLRIWPGSFEFCDTLYVHVSAPNCGCITSAGTLREAGDTIQVCREITEDKTFVHNLDFVNDGDDGLFYLLYNGRPDSLGTVLFTSDFPTIEWDKLSQAIEPGYYYFSAAASTDSGSGFDQGEFCADVSPPVIIYVRSPPTASIGGDLVACRGSEPEIMLNLQGTPPFIISYERNGTPQNIQANTPNFSFRVLASRDITLRLTGLKDNFCAGEVSGEVHITTIGQDTVPLERTLCVSESLIIGADTFNMARPTGLAILPGAALGGCDSIMQVNLQFTTPDTVPIRWELCPGDTLVIGGEPFHVNHLTGLVPSSVSACDTIYDVQLKLYPATVDTVPLILCPDDTLTFLGEVFHAGSASRLIELTGQSTSGCDSLVYVDIQPHLPAVAMIRDTLCAGDFRMFAGERFDADRSSGMVSAGTDAFGCDSLLDIQLTFLPFPVGFQAIALCPGEVVEIEGVFFSETHLNDTVRLVGESARGCDSLVVIAAELLQPSETFLALDLCNGSQLLVNGHVYDQSKPSGTEILPGANAQGCDSIIHVDLQFTEAVHFLLTTPICPGDFIVVDTAVFDANRPTGSILLPGASHFGCDSIVDVELLVVESSTSQLVLSLCPGEFVMVNGMRYDAQVPSGTEVILGGNQWGCDSVIQIQLTFDTLMIQAQATSSGCQTNGAKMLEITNLINGHPPYRFSLNDEPYQGIPALPFSYPVSDTATVVRLRIIDQSGCEASTTVSFVDTSAQAFVSLGPDREVMLGEPVTITLETNVSLTQYTLYAPDGSTCQNCLPKTFDLMQTGAFRIQATDAQGCTYSDDVNIFVSESSRLFIPNIFSPNGDGQNDDIRLYPGSNLVLVHTFIIRDVWGEIVFEAHDYYPDGGQPVWDGRLKGKPVRPGVFHYFVDVEFTNGSRRILNGDITLIR